MARFDEYYKYRETMRIVSKDIKKSLQLKDKRFIKTTLLENKMIGTHFYKINELNSKVGQKDKYEVFSGIRMYLSEGGDGCVPPYMVIEKINLFRIYPFGKICAIAKYDSMLNSIKVDFLKEPFDFDAVNVYSPLPKYESIATTTIDNPEKWKSFVENFEEIRAEVIKNASTKTQETSNEM